MTLRPLRAYREISRDLSDLRASQRTAEADARKELAQRATIFSSRSKKVVDETMSLSAVLMRAGEVDEAHRLLAEVDREVAEEKVALIESVNEVKTRQVVARKKMTRLRMARMLLTAILGASLMAFSAFGVALARFLAPAPAQGAQAENVRLADRGDGAELSKRNLKRIRFAGVTIPLTDKQLAQFERLKASGADDAHLSEFLKKVLSPDLAGRIVTLAAPATDAATDLLGTARKTVKETSSSSSSQSSSSTTEKKADEKQQSSNSDSGDEDGDDKQGSNDDKGCDGGSEEDKGDSSSGPVGDCVPVINEESPV